MIELKKLKKGELFLKKEPVEGANVRSSAVWVKGDYIPEERQVACGKRDHMNQEHQNKGSTLVCDEVEY